MALHPDAIEVETWTEGGRKTGTTRPTHHDPLS